jgi:amino acid transporter
LVLATPIVLSMFVLGTASVVSLRGLHASTTINYAAPGVAPIPQALSLAFDEGSIAALLGKAAILLLQIRILGAASFLFTGAMRLPMTAGWDHLIPAWFARLHPSYRTATNSIYVTSTVICGAKAVRERLPWWTAAACACGVMAIVVVLVLKAYPFVDAESPGVVAVKIPRTLALVMRSSRRQECRRLRRPQFLDRISAPVVPFHPWPPSIP